MKHIKKVVTLALAFAMVLAMSATAFAISGEGNNTITLEGGKKGHTYTIYQIFTGTVEDGALTGIQWGDGLTTTFKATKPTAAAYAKEIQEQNDARATAQALQKANALTNGTDVALSADGNVVFSGLPEGYYIIVDDNGNTSGVEGDYTSALIVEVIAPQTTAKLKGSAPTSEKKVKDGNSYVDAADFAIGDDIPFQLKATTANNVSSYVKYHVTFQDKQSSGLDAPSTFTITIPGTTETLSLANASGAKVTKAVTFGSGSDAVTVNATAEIVTPAEGRTFAIKVSFDVPEAEDATVQKYLPAGLNSQDILVDYTSKLNSNAVMGSNGNPNDMHIDYSNNPEDFNDSEEGKTPDDKVTVFTYKLVVDKKDESGNPLKGAGFTLYKVDGSTETQIGEEVSGTDMTSFTWTGLDSGSYKLVETTVPTGYTKAEDITFDVVATYDQTAANPQLTSLEVKNVNPATTTFNVVKDATGENNTSNINTTVVNRSGAALPETGGIGTVIFYVFGSLLVIGCGIVLVSRKRTNN